MTSSEETNETAGETQDARYWLTTRGWLAANAIAAGESE